MSLFDSLILLWLPKNKTPILCIKSAHNFAYLFTYVYFAKLITNHKSLSVVVFILGVKASKAI